MKILSWNLERPNNNLTSEKNIFIIDIIEKINPDIIFFTETNSSINFKTYFSHQSIQLPKIHEKQEYKNGENRVTIFSKFPIENISNTYDCYTAICCLIDSPIGKLTLYGSIIGSFGGRDKYFENDLKNQKVEIEKLARNQNLIYSGDFNISFSGFPYPSKVKITEMNEFFDSNSLTNLTGDNKDSAIHIVLSEEILKNRIVSQKMIEIDRKISDHNLILVEIQ